MSSVAGNDASNTGAPDIDLTAPELYINRELSHLNFHRRVLALAKDEQLPLLERLRFLLIFDRNIDEFFEIRVAGLMKKVAYHQGRPGPDGLGAGELLNHISVLAHELVEEQYRTLNEELLPALRQQNVSFLRRREWTPEQSEWVKRYFMDQVAPVMSSIGLDPAHPFPRLANKTLNFIVSLEGRDAFGYKRGLAIVPAPRSLPRLIEFPASVSSGGHDFVFLSAIIHAHAEELFPGLEVKGCYQFRVTRDADLYLDEEVVEDLALALKGELQTRHFGHEVRLEVADNCPQALVDFLLKQFNLGEQSLYRVAGMVNMSRMMQVTDLELSHLSYPLFSPGIPRLLKVVDMFSTIRQRDVLLYHPFNSFRPIVELLRQAARDPNVLAIKQTLYRTGAESEVTRILVEAAQNGKEVTAVVELRARFDEQNNIDDATALQKAGAIVAYGIVGYKTHAKMSLVVRREGGHLQRYLHLGTGNYHPGNARIYTDFSLLTCHPGLGQDAHVVFQQLTGMGHARKLLHFLHAPFNLHSGLMAFIHDEIEHAQRGEVAKIMIKVNGLTDPSLIQALYRAAQAGVDVELLVRGVCCLKPGVPGVSDRIRVRSIVGRFLEHARVYYFYAGGTEQLYLSSADGMERNLFNRVEIAFPILDFDLKHRVIEEAFSMALADNVDAWDLQTSLFSCFLVFLFSSCASAFVSSCAMAQDDTACNSL
ncbi:MAG: polyphosphate kinase 1 [Gammaproteobacteria bacterium]